MTSGQWDLNALEALERESLGTFDILDIPEHLCPKIKPTTEMVELELQDHIKHCSCSCNHMGYGNFMDYQATFGDLPDVTEHSYNPTVLPDSISNTELSITNSQRSSSQQNNINNLNNKPMKKRNFLCAATLLFILTTCAVIAGLLIQFFFGTQTDRNSHEQRMYLVRRILRDTPLIDGHNDLPWNIKRFAHNRLEYLNFTDGLDKINPWSNSPWSQTDLPRLRKGLVGAQFWSAYVPCEAQGLDAVQLALEQIDLIRRLTDAHSHHMQLVTTTQDIITTHNNGLIGSMIGVEGGHSIGSSLGVLRSMYSLGVRYLTLTHTCDTRWAGTADSSEKGLSPFGRAVIKEMNRMGMIIDLSHTSDATSKDVFETTRAPVIYSHSASRTLCNLTRNIGDDFLREISDNGGLIMVSFYSLHVACGKIANINDVIAHINYIRTVAGIQHVGIGAGYDGIDSTPQGLEDVSKYPELFAKLLEDPTWSEENISLLAGKNFLRVLKSVENVRDYWKRTEIPPFENSEPPKRSPCTYMPS